MMSARFRRHTKGLQNHFAAKGYSRRAAKLASTLRFSGSSLRHISGNFRRKYTTLYKKAAKSLRNKRVISQHLAKCFLQLGVIDLQWLLHQLDFRKCSTSGCHDCHQEYASWQILFTSSPCTPDLLLANDFQALPKIPHNFPQSWIALSEKETEKREEIKGKKKGSSGRKEDHDSTVNEDLEKIVINEDVMKKHMPPPFPQALHGKKGISNAS
ncbi:hypothetical protein CK203_105718 [Vitis vinifera]|uniref:Uncharacterized protein n=1 Tax=Vitis vinifera TaxID=29760 RepID=A0A438BPI6_VITVI|nr:hypothetical protein CK203_105718 [Vitis vinifera]